MKRQVPLWPIALVAIFIVAAIGYFVMIRPKRAEAGHLDEQIAELQMKVAAAQLAARSAEHPQAIKVADLFQVSKAMPDSADMPGVILDLNSVAQATGTKFISIQPGAYVAKNGYTAIAIDLVFEGNYFDLSDFLFRLRNLVTVRDGRLGSSGRLFTLDAISMKEAHDGFPNINAGLTVSAYAFGTDEAAAGGGTATTPAPSETPPPPPPSGGIG
jgi:Tfp pilus assembly protein PilO